jgi:hypothetical protein
MTMLDFSPQRHRASALLFAAIKMRICTQGRYLSGFIVVLDGDSKS